MRKRQAKTIYTTRGNGAPFVQGVNLRGFRRALARRTPAELARWTIAAEASFERLVGQVVRGRRGLHDAAYTAVQLEQILARVAADLEVGIEL